MKKLSDFANNAYSQFGEDGIIEKIYEIIGVTSKVCIEFGAWDGFHFSNTANLWTNGWKGILIEANLERFKQLVKNVEKFNCHCIRETVGYEGQNTLEKILEREEITDEIDLLSIDIDGDDYYVFDALQKVHPRIVICEYNPTIPIQIELIPQKINYFGCSAVSLIKLAQRKGYKLITMTETNCFFVTEELYGKFSGYSTSLQDLATKKHITYLMSGYDGRFVLSQRPTYMREYLQPSDQKFQGDYFKPEVYPTFPKKTIFKKLYDFLRYNLIKC